MNFCLKLYMIAAAISVCLYYEKDCAPTYRNLLVTQLLIVADTCNYTTIVAISYQI